MYASFICMRKLMRSKRPSFQLRVRSIIRDMHFINFAINTTIKFKIIFLSLRDGWILQIQTPRSKFYSYPPRIISLLTTMNLRSRYAASSVNAISPIHRTRLRHAQRTFEIRTSGEKERSCPGRVERIFGNSICPTRTLFLSACGIRAASMYLERGATSNSSKPRY